LGHKSDETLLTGHAGHNTADVLCDPVQMCDGVGIQQLVLQTHKERRALAGESDPQRKGLCVHTDRDFLLRDDHDAVLPSDRHRGQSSLVDGFKGIF